MAYKMSTKNRWAKTRSVTLQSSVTKTATFNSASVEIGDQSTARLDLVVSAASGTTPTLDVKLQTSVDGSTWVDVASFAQQTTTTAGVHKVFTGLDRFVRIVATIGGTTPSFTYAVTGETC